MSWGQPVVTAEFAAVGVTSLLEAVRAVDTRIRVYQASSSEIFGEPAEVPQTEATPLSPVTPYGVAKAYGHFIIRSYRRRYGLHASCGILYNHESPRRPVDFLPSKVAHAAAAISLGLESELLLGDLDAQRDWGYAGDYVDAMWRMLQQDEPADYVIATGELHTVRGARRDRVRARRARLAAAHVRVDDSLLRGQAELHHLVGDAAKAREAARLGADASASRSSSALLVDAAVEGSAAHRVRNTAALHSGRNVRPAGAFRRRGLRAAAGRGRPRLPRPRPRRAASPSASGPSAPTSRSSAGPVAKGWLAFQVKRVLRKTMRWYVEPAFAEQRIVNDALLRLVDDLSRRVDELESRRMRLAVCMPQVPFERGGTEIFADGLVARCASAATRRSSSRFRSSGIPASAC